MVNNKTTFILVSILVALVVFSPFPAKASPLTSGTFLIANDIPSSINAASDAANFIQGGYHQVKDISSATYTFDPDGIGPLTPVTAPYNLLSIPCKRRENGMMVYVQDTFGVYRLEGAGLGCTGNPPVPEVGGTNVTTTGGVWKLVASLTGQGGGSGGGGAQASPPDRSVQFSQETTPGSGVFGLKGTAQFIWDDIAKFLQIEGSTGGLTIIDNGSIMLDKDVLLGGAIDMDGLTFDPLIQNSPEANHGLIAYDKTANNLVASENNAPYRKMALYEGAPTQGQTLVWDATAPFPTFKPGAAGLSGPSGGDNDTFVWQCNDANGNNTIDTGECNWVNVGSGLEAVYIRGTSAQNPANRVVKIGNTNLLPSVQNTALGLDLCIVNATTHTLVSCTAYSTNSSTAASDSLATALNNLQRTQIGILTSYGTWEQNVTNNLRTAARRLGLFKLASVGGQTRKPYAAIFEGSGVSTGNTEPGRQVMEVMESGAVGAPRAILTTWLTEDGFGAPGLPNALISSNANVSDPAVLVDGNSNVGIGTNNPTVKLAVRGNTTLLRDPAVVAAGPGPSLTLESVSATTFVTTPVPPGGGSCQGGQNGPACMTMFNTVAPAATSAPDNDETTYSCTATDAALNKRLFDVSTICVDNFIAEDTGPQVTAAYNTAKSASGLSGNTSATSCSNITNLSSAEDGVGPLTTPAYNTLTQKIEASYVEIQKSYTIFDCQATGTTYYALNTDDADLKFTNYQNIGKAVLTKKGGLGLANNINDSTIQPFPASVTDSTGTITESRLDVRGPGLFDQLAVTNEASIGSPAGRGLLHFFGVDNTNVDQTHPNPNIGLSPFTLSYPPVSLADSGIIYFDKLLGRFRVSESGVNGGDYHDLGSGGGGESLWDDNSPNSGNTPTNDDKTWLKNLAHWVGIGTDSPTGKFEVVKPSSAGTPPVLSWSQVLPYSTYTTAFYNNAVLQNRCVDDVNASVAEIVDGTPVISTGSPSPCYDVFVPSPGAGIPGQANKFVTALVGGPTSPESLFIVKDDGKIGAGTNSPTYDFSFDGDSAKIIGLNDRTTTGAGANLIVRAGAGSTGGGDLILDGGQSYGDIIFRNTAVGGLGQLVNSENMILTGRYGLLGLGISGLTDAPRAKLHIFNSSGIDGIGTISGSGGNVTGSGTKFTRDLDIGGKTTMNGTDRIITSITSDTALKIEPAGSVSGNFTYLPKMFNIGSPAGSLFQVNSAGNVGINTNLLQERLDVFGGARIGQAPATSATFYNNSTLNSSSADLKFNPNTFSSSGVVYPYNSNLYPLTGTLLIDQEAITYAGVSKSSTSYDQLLGATRGAFGTAVVSHDGATADIDNYLLNVSGGRLGSPRLVVTGKGKVGVNTPAPHSTLQVGGSFATAVTNVSPPGMVATPPYVYTATINDNVILVNAITTAGAPYTGNNYDMQINLPPAASVRGRQYSIKKVDTSTKSVTIDPAGSETIDGVATLVLLSQNDGTTIVSDGANWKQVGGGGGGGGKWSNVTGSTKDIYNGDLGKVGVYQGSVPPTTLKASLQINGPYTAEYLPSVNPGIFGL